MRRGSAAVLLDHRFWRVVAVFGAVHAEDEVLEIGYVGSAQLTTGDVGKMGSMRRRLTATKVA